MKKIIAKMVMSVAVITLCSYSFVSCSGGSGSSGGIFGDVPGVAEKHTQEGIEMSRKIFLHIPIPGFFHLLVQLCLQNGSNLLTYSLWTFRFFMFVGNK